MIAVWANILLIKIHSNVPGTLAQHSIIFVGVSYSKPCDTVKGMIYYKLQAKYCKQVLSTYCLTESRGKKVMQKQKSL